MKRLLTGLSLFFLPFCLGAELSDEQKQKLVELFKGEVKAETRTFVSELTQHNFKIIAMEHSELNAYLSNDLKKGKEAWVNNSNICEQEVKKPYSLSAVTGFLVYLKHKTLCEAELASASFEECDTYLSHFIEESQLADKIVTLIHNEEQSFDSPESFWLHLWNGIISTGSYLLHTVWDKHGPEITAFAERMEKIIVTHVEEKLEQEITNTFGSIAGDGIKKVAEKTFGNADKKVDL